MAEEPEPAIDVAVLDSLEKAIGDDPAFLRELVETYLEEAPRQIEAILTGVATGDVEQVHRAAHTLKSISATVGAEALSAAARELETLSLLAEPEIAPLIDVISDEFGRARDELDSLVPAVDQG